MREYYYLEETRGFYTPEVHNGFIRKSNGTYAIDPNGMLANAIGPISENFHTELLDRESDGDEIRVIDGVLTTAVPNRTTPDLKKEAEARLNIEYTNELVSIYESYDILDVYVWSEQLREAREWSNNPATNTPMLDSIVAYKLVSKDVLASELLSTSDNLKEELSTAFVKRQTLIDQLYATTDPTEIVNINW